ncbi:hypothetical protein DFJ58DRAFT_728316 [Suillus subalutaceus]|uniref:uncharacterized protein n=1 Tax=Suillus subalutaceus TaxID=48586 RepID=UPI001B886804|nr:uncharacterized protein DFJ58DRAFT_728316 [Suillus subalutaceus]KAG1853198.1 hypothetical protein DFJ58DRAFT_728316 [Suillus subalutaceus]
MSSSQNNTNNVALNTSSPQHQLNDPSQSLRSGSRATVQTQVSLPANIERVFSSAIHSKNTSAQSDDAYPTRATLGTERQLGVQPTPEDGIAIDGQPNPPEGHAGFGDGKTQKASLVL